MPIINYENITRIFQNILRIYVEYYIIILYHIKKLNLFISSCSWNIQGIIPPCTRLISLWKYGGWQMVNHDLKIFGGDLNELPILV